LKVKEVKPNGMYVYDDVGGSLLVLLIYTKSSTNIKSSTNSKQGPWLCIAVHGYVFVEPPPSHHSVPGN
jgi:hypothetical protein